MATESIQGIPNHPDEVVMKKDDTLITDETDSDSDAEQYEDAIEDLDELISLTNGLQVTNSGDAALKESEKLCPQGSTDASDSDSKHESRLEADNLVDEVINESLGDGDFVQCSGGVNETDEYKCQENCMRDEEDTADTDAPLEADVSEEEEEEDGKKRWDDGIDEDGMKELEALMTDEEKQEKKDESQTLKKEGNDLFKEGLFQAAMSSYTAALRICPLCFVKERSIMYSNRGACKYRLEDYKASIEDCSKALELNTSYLKALLRRAECYEKTDKLDEALADYQKVVEMDPSQIGAREACMRLPDQIQKRNEKMKEEMLDKLKDLGNLVLRPFGLSTENFKLQQDPNSGGYSVNFVQNQPNK